MELYDGDVEQKSSKAPMIIGVCIAILVVITILIIAGILYLKASIKTITIDGVKNSEIEELLYVEESDNESELYLPIIKMASIFGQEAYNGDYKNKSEDKTKCHTISENEIVMFTKDSNILIKTNKNSEYEYIELDKTVIQINEELYTTIQGIENAFNVSFSVDQNFKNINIYTMNFLVDYYAKQNSIEEYSTEFSDQKAIFEGKLITIENNKYGVIDIANKQYILQPKYEYISYMPITTDFLIKSNGQYGIVTKDATTKIKIAYDEIKVMDIQKGLYLVRQNNAYGVIDINGNIIIQPEYKQIGIDATKYTQNGIENQYILLDEIIPIQNNQGLWGLFNIKGEKVVDFKYTGVGCLTTPANNSYVAIVIPSSKIIVVEKDKKYNLVTTTGKELISGYILDSVYLKVNAATEEKEYYMTANNNTKVINVEEYLTKIGE